MAGQRVPVVSFSIPVPSTVKIRKMDEEKSREREMILNQRKNTLGEKSRPSSSYSLTGISRTLNRSSDYLSEMMIKGRNTKTASSSPSSPSSPRNRSRTLTRTISVSSSCVAQEVNDHHFLFRSVHLTEDVSNLLRERVSPLKVFDFNKEFPKGLSWFEKAHKKHSEAIFAKSTRGFIWNTGKWMKRVARILNVVNDVVNSLRNESSVILTEDTDNLFNPLVSTLVQVVLDPKRRTINGLESLLSKEWMFLTGFANGYPSSMKTPNAVLFALFIDCLHQLIAFSRNVLSFEYTSLYLIRIFDHHLLPSDYFALTPVRDVGASFEDLTKIGSVIACQSNVRMRKLSSQSLRRPSFNSIFEDSCSSLSTTSLPMTLSDMTIDQLVFMFNPFYERTCLRNWINVPKRAAELVFFEGLYLRWHCMADKNGYYRRFPLLEEAIYNQILLDIDFRRLARSITSSKSQLTSSGNFLNSNEGSSGRSSRENVVEVASSSYSETEL